MAAAGVEVGSGVMAAGAVAAGGGAATAAGWADWVGWEGMVASAETVVKEAMGAVETAQGPALAPLSGRQWPQAWALLLGRPLQHALRQAWEQVWARQ